MDEGKYLSEASGRLRRAGFTVEQDERLASISLDSQPLCQINGSGGVRRGVQADGHLDAACDRAVEIVRTTAAYMWDSFDVLEEYISEVNRMAEDGGSLDETRVKAIFYTLYFGTDSASENADWSFVDCFTNYETRTRTVTVTDEDGNETEMVESYTAAIPIDDLSEVYQNLNRILPEDITEEQKNNAESIYSLIRYGYTGGINGGGIGATDLPFIGADGFCSPVGAGWREKVTSEFGYRRDPFTGETKGHSGMDIAVPTGTSVRAALPGTVIVSQYSSSYGYYIMIDHGGGFVTLYAHNSQLLASVGQTVQAGDVVSLSGSTGRSTGPHVHFEVRINGERTNPRPYLP